MLPTTGGRHGRHRAFRDGEHGAPRRTAGGSSVARLALVAAVLAIVGGGARAAVEPDQARFRFLSLEGGLSHTDVYAIRQDRAGFVWIGTEDGLDRYDGYRFEPMGREGPPGQRLSSYDVAWLYEDGGGAMWIGTWGGGLGRYDPRSGRIETFRHDPQVPRSLSDNRVHAVLEDRAGRIWVATYRGLDHLEVDGSFAHYGVDPDNPESGLSHPRVWAISEDRAGRLWLGTEAGLDRLDPESGEITHYRHAPDDPRSPSHDLVRALFHDRGGTLWVGTERGLNRYAPASDDFTRYTEDLDDPEALFDDTINVIFEDSEGTLWVGAHRGGLHRFDRRTGTFDRYPTVGEPGGLSNDDVRTIMEDDSGILWVGTRGGGVNLLPLEPPKFWLHDHHPEDPASIPPGVVRSVFVDSAGALWVGTDRGLRRLGPGDGEVASFGHRHGDPESLAGDSVRALWEERPGDLWIGAYGGLHHLDVESGTLTHFIHDPKDPATLSSDRVEALLQTADGTLWVGTRDGLDAVDTGRRAVRRIPSRLGEEGGLADSFIWVLAEAASGGIWVGTDVGGLYHYDPAGDRFRRAPCVPDRVTSLFVDDEAVWVGTTAGLSRYDPVDDACSHVDERDGLPSSRVNSVLGDDDGRLWLASTSGLSRYDPSSGHVHTYGRTDGLQGPIFTPGVAFLAPDGAMFFGGARGLNAFHPDEIRHNAHTPPVVLTDLEIRNRPTPVGGPLTSVRQLDLAWAERSISFEFAGLDFTDPARNRYEYRLDGFDDGWVAAGDRRRATYTNLEPGDYRFLVRAANADGVWNPQPLELSVTVARPYWMTWWFRGGLVLLAVGAVLTAHRWRTSRFADRARQLEAEVASRTAELAREKRHLETVDTIVKLINEETDLAELLRSILEGISFLEVADRAVALVRDPESGRLEVAAAVGVESSSDSDAQPEVVGVDLAGVLDGGTELAAGVWLLPAGEIELAGLLGTSDGNGSPVLAVVIDDDEADASGYLLFGNSKGDAGWVDESPERLVGLREHATAALRKVRMLAALRELNEAKNEFLGIAAHDLRSPLGGISSHADLLLRLAEEEPLDRRLFRRFLGNVKTMAEQMRLLVSDLLDVTAIESGRVPMSPARERLSELIEEAEELHKLAASRKEIELVVETDGAGVEVEVDRARIGEVLDNLLSNAIKFTPPGGRVVVYCEARDDEVLTHVEDTGLGLEPGELEHAFTGKRLSARPTGDEASTGLGLVIVRKLVELHGGRVWVESSKGSGSTFSFSLPLAS